MLALALLVRGRAVVFGPLSASGVLGLDQTVAHLREKKQIGNSEREMKAVCADGSARWESTVRLSLSFKEQAEVVRPARYQTYVKCT
jgi:hypothetical protein